MMIKCYIKAIQSLLLEVEGSALLQSECKAADNSILNADQVTLKSRIELLLHGNAERVRLPKLKYCKALCECICDANQVVKRISTSTITEIVELLLLMPLQKD